MRRTGRTVFKNTISLLLARGIEGLVAVLMIAAISRHFGPQLFGDYAVIISIGAFLASFTYFGLERISIREVAKAKENPGEAALRFGTALATRWILTAAVTLALLILLLAGGYDRRYQLAIIITALSQFALAAATLYGAVFKAYEKMEYDVLLTAATQLVALLLVAAAIYLDLGFLAVFVALALSSVFRLLFSMRLCFRNFLKPKVVFDRGEIFSLIKESFIIGLNLLIVQAILRVDVFVLKWLKDSAEVSLFFAPHSLLIRLQAIPIALSTALFPFFSRTSRDASSAMQTGFGRAFGAMFFLSSIIMVAGMALAPQIIGLVYGKAFSAAALSFRILAPATIFLFLHPLIGFVLISRNKPLLMIPGSLAALLVNLVLGFSLIPRYGNVGASVASLAGYAVLFGVTCFSARAVVELPMGRFLFVPLGAAGFVMGTLYLFGGRAPFSMLLLTTFVCGASLLMLTFGFLPARAGLRIAGLPLLLYNLIRRP